MVRIKYIPERGDAVWINLNLQTGHEQSGRRPALVISPRAYNKKVRLAIFCSITNQIKGYPFEVVIPDGLEVKGAILSDQVKSLDWVARDTELICKLPHPIIEEVLSKLNTLLEA
ncbi:MAG: type II toxin-antitoxin system PemK/MazF family toxin [Acidobacteriota bacterium]